MGATTSSPFLCGPAECRGYQCAGGTTDSLHDFCVVSEPTKPYPGVSSSSHMLGTERGAVGLSNSVDLTTLSTRPDAGTQVAGRKAVDLDEAIAQSSGSTTADDGKWPAQEEETGGSEPRTPLVLPTKSCSSVSSVADMGNIVSGIQATRLASMSSMDVQCSSQAELGKFGKPPKAENSASNAGASPSASTATPGTPFSSSSEAFCVAERLADYGDAGKEAERAWNEALKEMDNSRLLEAEQQLRAAMRAAQEADPKLAAELKRTRLYEVVYDRMDQYKRVGLRVLSFNDEASSSKFDLVWEGVGGDKVFLYLPGGGQTWAEVKVAIHIDAPLRSCLVPALELDLQPEWNKALIRTPDILGHRTRFQQVTRQLVGVLMFRIEVIFEVFRVCNKDFGFFAEMIRSDFPAEELGITLPPKESWRTKRIKVETSNVWIPSGGGPDTGTILVQVSRLDLGFAISKSVAKMAVQTLAGGIVGNLRKQATMARTPGSVWQQRMERDSWGMYAELADVEEAAAKRRLVTTATLPGVDVFEPTSGHSG